MMKKRVIVILLATLFACQAWAQLNVSIGNVSSCCNAAGYPVSIPITISNNSGSPILLGAFQFAINFPSTGITVPDVVVPPVQLGGFFLVHNPTATSVVNIAWFNLTPINLAVGGSISFNLDIIYNCTAAAVGAFSFAGTPPSTLNVASDDSGNDYIINFTNSSGSLTKLVLGTVGVITGSATACAGSVNQLYSITNVTNATGYSWAVPGGISITSGGTTTNVNLSFANNTSGPYIITCTASDNCGNTTSNTKTITVTALPSGTGIITGQANVCQGTTWTFTVNGIVGATTYNWILPAGCNITAGSGTNSITVNFTNTAATGPGQITVQGQNACGLQYTANTPFSINIHPMPTANAGLDATTNPGVPVTLNGSASGGSGAPYTYSWTPTNMLVAGQNTLQNPTTIGLNADQTYSLVVTDSYGCSSAPDQVLVQIVGFPLAISSITATPSTVCSGSPTTLLVTPTGGSLVYTYSWTSVPAGFTSTSQSPVANPTVSTTYYVTVTDNATPPASITANVPVTVNPLPVPTITGPANMCRGIINNIYTTQPGMTNYIWNIPPQASVTAGGGNTNNSVTLTWNTAGTWNVGVTYTNGNTCTGTSAPYQVIVDPLPTASITGNPAGICMGGTSPAFTGIGSGGSNIFTTYAWSYAGTGSVTFGTPNQASTSVSGNAVGSGTITLIVTDSKTCTASVSVPFEVYANPTAGITGLTPNPICLNQSWTNVNGNPNGGAGVPWTSQSWSYTGGIGISFTASGSQVTDISLSGTGNGSITYTVVDSHGCSAVSTVPVTVNGLPTPTITGPSAVCNNTTNAVYTTQAGMTTYSWTVTAGGTIVAGGTPTDNTATISWTGTGNQTVSVNYYNASGCTATNPGTYSVFVTPLPTANITYTGSPYCKTLVAGQSVTLTGTNAYTGGTYSSTPAGLSLNAGTGSIIPSSSTAGTYTVTYTIPASAGCAIVTATATVIITALPTASLNYAGSPFCNTLNTGQAVTLTGTNAYTGGSYSSTPGLTLDPITGEVTPGTSTAGSYTVTYTVPASAGCGTVNATTTVVITPLPTASISYAGTPFCKTLATAQNVTLTGTNAYTGGTYSSTPAGLTLVPTTGAITPSSSAVGTYTVTYTLGASGGCAIVTTTTTVVITPLPTATITYAGNPFCSTVATAQPVTLSGTNAYTGGTYSSLPVGLILDPNTGDVTPGTSAPGTYTVTYTIAAAGGCAAVTTTTGVTITPLPTATITYSGSPYCKTLATPQAVTLTGTNAYTTGTYSASPGGLTINTTTGAITPSSSTAGTYTVTYTIAATGGCAVVTATASITITPLPTASINYAGSPFCSTVAAAQSVTLTGTNAYTGGTYSAPAGLVIDAGTGEITPSSSTPGTYTVTYTIAAAGGCAIVTATTNITITPLPTANISYSGTPYCKTLAIAQTVVLTGTNAYTGGTYTVLPVGLTINPATGSITPSSSNAGTYTVTYTIAAAGGCGVVTATTTVVITPLPTATITYPGSPFCSTVATAQNVTLTGTNAYTGGTYSAPAGLVIDAGTGEITPSTSTPGTYTVTYTIAAAGGCAIVTATTNITITPLPTANISYSGTPYCKTVATAQTITLTGTNAYTGGTYTVLPVGLTINPATGSITPSTSNSGTYTVTYTIAAAGGCGVVTATTTVVITPLPTATITYPGSPFCSTVATAQNVTLTGTNAYTGGTFTSAPVGLNLDPTTGAVTPGSSTPGTYTVTYTIAASAGCAIVTATATVIITPLPTAGISYAGTPFCSTLATGQAVTLSGTNAYTGGVYSASPGGLSINTTTGAIVPSTSVVGTYIVTYTLAATGGCAVVTATTTVTVTALPTATITYPGSPYCIVGATPQPVTLTGTNAYTGGIFSTSPAGLTINPATGAVTPSTSTAGTYTVTYTIAASSGCAIVTATATIVITPLQDASFTYGGATFCQSGTDPVPTITGSLGGTFTFSPSGLVINASTGLIDLSASTLNTYSITYTTPGFCPNTSTVNITITLAPSASFSYTGSPYCSNLTDPTPTFSGGGTAGTFTAIPAGLVFVNTNTGEVDLTASTPGTYSVTNSIVASGGCAAISAISPITITLAPSATISYAQPFCTSQTTPQTVNLIGLGAYTGGTYSSVPVGLNLNTSTGAITPSTSTPGTYTITYTIAASGGCAVVTTTTTVTITPLPTASIIYPGSPFCTTVSALQPVTLTGTNAYLGGVFSASPGGLSISPTTGEITPSASTAGTYTVTYTIAAAGGCAVVTATATIIVTPLPVASIAYAGTPFCTTLTVPQAVTLSGANGYTGGTYTSAPAGLALSGTTGAITPSTSTPGSYTVTYTIAAAGGCAVVATTTNIVITPLPTASITYAGSPFCNTLSTPQSVTLTGTGGYTGGVYSSTAGLVLNSANGEIIPSTSTPGTYTVTYTIAATGGCAVVTATATVIITPLPTANINYAGTPYCKTLVTSQAVTLTGTNAYTGGTYSSSPAGLSINAGTGAILPSASNAGTYTVTYTIAAAGGCAVVTATAGVTITPLPTATIAYAGNPFCNTVATPQPVTLTGSNAYTGGVYSSTPIGLTLDANSGSITPNSSTAGTYTVTYTIAAAGGCAVVTATATVIITPLPTANINYAGTPYCSTVTTSQAVTLTGTNAYTGGTYSSLPAGLTLNTTTGAIIPSTSVAGTYTVTYTVAAAGGCAVVTATTGVTITPLPTATISYAGTPYCNTLATAQSVTLNGTNAYTGGTFTALPAGLTINATSGAITPNSSTAGTYTVTYTIAAAGGCAQVTATATVVITPLPTAVISYTGTPYCNTITTPQLITLTGTNAYTGGTYTASPAGLIINATTGSITPSTSAAGTYTVTYTIPAAGGCALVSATTTVTITPLPTASISYAGNPFCSTVSTPQSVTLTGTNAYTGGTYTSAPIGLSINATTGAINPGSSTAGTYTVTYTIAAAAGCAVVTATTTVIITPLPTANISYSGTPFCKTQTIPQGVTLTGTNAYTGGVYSSTPAGLTLNTTTGSITPSSSTAGTYTVTYTIAAAGGCAVVTATTSVIITPLPTATISYAGSPYCNTVATAQNVTITGTNAYTGGTYTALPVGLTINPGTGAVTPNTSAAGTYTVTYTIPAAGGCAVVTATATVIITPLPTASISYAGTPFCTTLTTAQAVTLNGTNAYTGGTYSATPAGLSINPATGGITPSTSTPGTYTITYTIAAAGGCAVVTATTTIVITPLPTATISYAGSPYCITGTAAQVVTLTGTNAYTGGVFSALPSGLTIDPVTGAVTPNTSTAGTYIVTYTIAAAAGCAVVTANATVVITPLQDASFTYGGATFCQTGTDPTPTITGSPGGTFTSTPPGLVINATTGVIDVSASALNTYAVTYTTPGFCPNFSIVNVTITLAPSANFSYTGTPYCSNLANAVPTFTGGGTAGTFTAVPPGLIFVNVNTGEVDLVNSAPGTYSVTNNIVASGGCAAATATSPITITTAPSATIVYAQPFCTSVTTPQSVTLTGTGGYTGGTYTSLPVGLSMNAGTGAITPSTSTPGTYTITYTIAAGGGCASVSTTSSVTITPLPTASITYAGTPFCNTLSVPQTVTLTGTNAYTGGVYSATPVGLTINATSGDITPSSSTAGTYTVTYTIAAAGGCAIVTATATIIITPLPTAIISYSGTPFCTTLTGPQGVTLTGTNAYTGGVYSASPAGLSINPGAGDIIPSTSLPGTYTVTYTIAAAGGCAVVTALTSVIITPLPTATISYVGTPFCNTVTTAEPVTLAGTNAYTGGSYSALPTGLTLDPTTGAITPSSSTPGTYVVTYTIGAAAGCAVVTTTANIVITPLPTATISYAGTPYCNTLTTAQTVTLNGTNAYTGGTYSALPAGLSLNATTGEIIPSTSTPGTYTITYTIAAAGGCAVVTATTSVVITPLPTATIAYAGSPYCNTVTTGQTVTLTGTNAYTGGTYTAVPGGLSIDAVTGDIIPSTSTPGTYTVTYTIAAAGGCAIVTATATVIITPLPTATISYAGTPFCSTLTTAQAVTLAGTNAYTGGTYSALPLGLSLNATTGDITPSTSTPGTYTVTYTIAAAAGCAIVTATTTIIITPIPTATISYSGTPFCNTLATPQSVTLSGTNAYTGGAYSALPAGLTIDAGTGAITPSTSTPGTYTVTYTIAAAGGCAVVTTTTTIVITPLPTAGISYTGTPFCTTVTTAQAVTLTGTNAYTGGTYTALPLGLSINATTGAITPSTSTPGTYTVTYTVAAAGGCAIVTATTTVVITPLPTATISYAGTPFCNTVTTPQSVTLTGTNGYTGGTYSALPVGLTIDANTGAIIPSTSTAGTYTITYTIPAAGGCAVVTTTTTIVITPLPTATISYAGTPFCNTLTTAQTVTLGGTNAYTGGTFSATPAGLSINATTGSIIPSTSTSGTYTVTYTIAAAGGCAIVTATTTVVITPLPTATISYAGTPFCKTVTTSQAVTLTGTNGYTGGAYSALPVGLTIDANTGAIIPSTSTAGTYTVTYTIPAAGGCAVVTATTTVTITPLPTANISYTGTPFCNTLATPQTVTLTGTNAYTGGTFSATPATLVINATTGSITPSTSPAGSYTVTYTIAAAGGCAVVTETTTVVITALPTATISYAGTPFCKTVTTGQLPTLTGTNAYTVGTYSASPVGLSILAATGAITPSTSIAGTYTVTYTIPAAGGCAVVTATATVVITALPTATITYPGSPFCSTLATPQPVTLNGTNAYTGGVFSFAPVGLVINTTTGSITPSTSTAGTYTVTYTVAAAGGCAAVTATTTVIITPLPTATISYAGTPFCKTITTAQLPTISGTNAYTTGTYSAAPAGLSIIAATGAITPSTSTAGTYTVTYTIPAAGGCAIVTATTTVVITALPTANIVYSTAPFCITNTTPQTVTLTGTGGYTGGAYSSTVGLTINATTGTITPNTSTAGTYTVTYTIAAAAGCAAVTATATVIITPLPTATISYTGTPFCKTLTTDQLPTLTGTNAYTTGTYSAAPGGLTINATTGGINPSTSTAGTYTVTYTIPAAGGCAVVTATATVVITALPTATISYAGTPFCSTLTTAQNVTIAGTGGYTSGAYSATPVGLSINATTGAITPSTSAAGTYTVTYTIPAAGGCAIVTATTSVVITAIPTATITYAGSPYCKSVTTAQAVTLTGTNAYTGGTYSVTPVGLSLNSTNGDVTPSTSPANTYTVTYTISAAAGCAAVTATATVVIIAAPTANAGPDTTVCISDSLLIDHSASTNASGVSWTTNGDGTFSNSTILQPYYVPGPNDITNATVTLTLTVNGNTPCGAVSDDLILTISPQTLAQAGPDTAICAGQTYTLTDDTTTNANSFTWTSSGTGSFSNPFGMHPTYYPSPADVLAGNVTLFLNAVNTQLYCGNSTDSMHLTIKPLPLANAGIDTTICFGDLIQLHASPLGGTYIWSPAAGLSIDNVPDPIASPAVTTTYTVSVTVNGCSKTDYMVLTVRALPIVDAGPNADICWGDSTRLAANGAYSYIWSTGALTPATWVKPESTTEYFVTGYDDLGCHATDSVTVVVHPLPIVVITPPTYNICRDSTVDLTASGASMYHWSPSSGLSNNNGPLVTAFPRQTTTYIVTGITMFGCESQSSVTIHVYPTPEIVLKDSAYICLGNPFYLNAGYNDSASYQWQDGSTSQFYYVSEPNIYWVTVRNAGCAVSDTIVVGECTSMWVPSSFTPDGNNLNDVFVAKSFTDLKMFHMYIYNRWGEVIFHSTDINYGWDGRYDGKDCPEGVYVYVVEWEGQGNLAKEREGLKKGTILLLR